MSSGDFSGDISSHTFRGKSVPASHSSRPRGKPSASLTGSQHWTNDNDSKEMPAASLTQQYAQLQHQHDSLGSIGTGSQSARSGKAGVWNDNGSTGLGLARNKGPASHQNKASRIANTYQTSGTKHGSTSAKRLHPSTSQSVIPIQSTQQFLPPVAGAEQPYQGNNTTNGIQWQAPNAFPQQVSLTSRPPNLMAWVKSISKGDERGLYRENGDMSSTDNILTMQQLQEKYAQQYASLSATQHQQQLASTFPTPEQFQQFYLAQQAEMMAAQQRADQAEFARQQALKAQSQQPIENATLSLTWGPNTVAGSSSNNHQASTSQLAQTNSQASLGRTGSVSKLHASNSQSALGRSGSQGQFQPQPPSGAPPASATMYHSGSQSSLNAKQQQDPAATAPLQSSSSRSALGLIPSASQSSVLLGEQVVLKAKGSRRDEAKESSAALAEAAEAEERRAQAEARELQAYQLEQQRARETAEAERRVVLQAAQPAARRAAAVEQQQQHSASAASLQSAQSFEFLVSPVGKGALHQTISKQNQSQQPPPMPFPNSALDGGVNKPSLYVHASTSQPLLGTRAMLDGMNSTASLPPPGNYDSTVSLGYGLRSTASLSTASTVALQTSFEDVRLNSSRISVDLDAPGAAHRNPGNKVVLNVSAKDLPANRNVVVALFKRLETAASNAASSGGDAAANPAATPTSSTVDVTGAADAASWEFIGCTELISSLQNPSFDRTFILDAPKASNALHAAASLTNNFETSAINGEMQLLAVTKRKHRLFSGPAGELEQPTIIKVQVLHIPQPDAKPLPPGITPNDTHLLPSPPSTQPTLNGSPHAEALGEAFFMLEQVLDLSNPQEFKLQPVPLTPAQILNLKRKQIELGRLTSHSQFAHLGSAVNQALQPPPVSGCISVQAKTIGILVPIDLGLSCQNLPVSEWMGKCDPIIVCYASNPNTGKFSWVGQTSRFRSTPSPVYADKLTIYSYSHCDRQLRFAVYDSELTGGPSALSKTGPLSMIPALNLRYREKDLLGEIFVSLDELVTAQDASRAAGSEIISASGDDDAATPLVFRLLRRRQVVKVGNQESTISIAAQMRPILLTSSHDAANANQEGIPASLAGYEAFNPTLATSASSAALEEEAANSTIVVGGSMNFRSNSQAVIPAPRGNQPHMYDPEYPQATAFGATMNPYATQPIPTVEESVLVQLSVACSGLPKLSSTSKCDPIVVLFAPAKPSTTGDANSVPQWVVLAQTERFVNSGEPVFHRLLQARLPLSPAVDGGGGDLRLAVYDSNETDHVRYHLDPSAIANGVAGSTEYLVNEKHLLGEHFFNLRLLVAYAQKQHIGKGAHSMHLDLVKHGRIVLRRKGAPMTSDPENLNANGAAQFSLQVLNIEELPTIATEVEAPVSDKLISVAQGNSPAVALSVANNLGNASSGRAVHRTNTSQIVLSVSARGLLKKNHSTLSPVATNPVVVIYISNPTAGGTFEFFAQTERKSLENTPQFQRTFLLDKEIVKGEHRPWLQQFNDTNSALVSSPLELKFCVFDVDAHDLFQQGELLGQAILPLSSLLFQSRQDLRLSNPETGEVVGHSVLTVQSTDVGQVTKAYLAIAANALPKNDWTSKCDPVSALYTYNPSISQYTYAGQTERIRTNNAPVFRRLIPVDVYAESDRPLRLAFFDTDADEMCVEKDLLGECFIQLKQLQAQADLAYAAEKAYEQSLLVAQARDGKHGGMQLPKRPDISPGLFVKLTTNHVIDVTAKRTVTASTNPFPASAASTAADTSATNPAEVFVQLVYDTEQYASELESGLQRHSVFQRKLAQDRLNQAAFERANAITTPEPNAALKSTQKMLTAGNDDRSLTTTQKSLVPYNGGDADSGVTEEAWQAVWTFTSSKKCTLFEHLPNGIQVSSQDLASLLAASKTLAGLMFHLKRFNEAKRHFNSLKEIVPAIHMAVASNTHVSQDVWQQIVKYLTSKDVELFSDSKIVQHSGLQVTIQQLDQAIVGAGGVDELLTHLKTYNLCKRKFETFAEILPAIIVTQKTGGHVTDEVWQAIRSYLSNPAIGLFRKDMDATKLKVLKKQEEQKENKSQLPEAPTPRKKRPMNSLQIDNTEQLLTISPRKSNASGEQSVSPGLSRAATPQPGRTSSVDLNATGSVDLGSNSSALVLANDPNQLDQLLVPLHPLDATASDPLAKQPTNAASSSSALVTNQNPRGQFMLIQMKGKDVDDCIINSNGSLSELLLHLQRFDDVYRKFAAFSQLPDAIKDTKACGSYLGSTVLNHVQAYINDQVKDHSCRLFSEVSQKPVVVNGGILDHLIHITGTMKSFKALLTEFDKLRRKFVRFADLENPIEAYVRLDQMETQVKHESALTDAERARKNLPAGQATIEALYGKGPTGYPKASAADRKELVGQLGGPFLALFSNVQEFRLTHGHLDALIYEGGGLKQTIGYLGLFMQDRRKFDDVDQLIKGIAHSSTVDKPVPDEAWQTVFRFFTNPKEGLSMFPKLQASFMRGDTSGLNITAAQLNELLLVPNGLSGLMIRLKHMRNEGLQFESFTQLVDEMRKREFFQIQREHGHTAIEKLEGPTLEEMKQVTITHNGRMAILAYLSSRDSKLIYHVGEIRINKEELDQLIYEAHGFEACIEHLKKLDQFRRMFGSIHELTFAVRVAHHRGYHITEADRQTLLSYLASPRSLLFSTAKHHPVAIHGSGIDDILAACDGNIDDVLVHLRQMDRVGRRFQDFSELAPAIALASRSSTHLSAEDRTAIINYLSSSASHLFSQSDLDNHVVDGPQLDNIFLDNPGRTGDEILRALRRFDALGRRFTSFPDLVKALKRAFKNDCFIDESTRQTILGYLMGPNVHLLQGPDHGTFAFEAVKGEEVDELFLTVNGNLIELLSILKQMNDLGRTFSHFGELAPQVSLIRQKALAKKQADLAAAMSVTGNAVNPPVRAPVPQLMPGSSGAGGAGGSDPNTSFLTLGGGQNPLLMSDAPPQSQLLSVYHYDENQNYNANNPPRISDEVFESIIAFLTRPGLKLFSKSTQGLSPNRALADRMVWVAGGLTPLLQHFETFEACGRFFNTGFAGLLPALVLAEKNRTHLLDVDQTLILDLLNDTEITIFRESGLQFRTDTIPGETLDALVVEAGGVAQFVAHVRAFSRVGRKFNRISELISALRQSRDPKNGSHLSPEVRTAIWNKLYPKNMSSTYVPLIKPGVELTGHDLDLIVAEGNGLDATLVFLSQLELTHQQFANTNNLLEGIRRVRNGLNLYEHITSETWSSVVAWLTSPANHIFSEAKEGISVDGPTLDTLLMRTGGLSGLIQTLKDVDAKNVKLMHFQDLLKVIAAPASSPTGISAIPKPLPTHMSTAIEPSVPTFLNQSIPAPQSATQLAPLPDGLTVIAPTPFYASPVNTDEQEKKYDQMGTGLSNPEAEKIEFNAQSQQQLVDYLAQPTSHNLFPALRNVTAPTDVFRALSITESDAKLAIYDAGGSVNALLAHLQVFSAVARVFNSWVDLVHALQDVKATGSHVTEETRMTLLTYLSSENCALFSNIGATDLHIDSEGIDNLIASAHGLEATMNHLKVLDACGIKYNSFEALSLGIVVAAQKGCHVSPSEQMKLRNYFVSCPLFEVPLSLEQTELSGLEFDRFFSCSAKKGFSGVEAHLQQFTIAGRKFPNITALLVAIERVVGGDSYVAESTREDLVFFLSEYADRLFDSSAAEAELVGADLDAIIFSANGYQPATQHMLTFLSLNRTFSNITELVAAVRLAQESQCHLSEADRLYLGKELARESSTLLHADLKPRAVLDGPGLDRLVLAAKGSVARLDAALKAIEAQKPEATRFDQLIHLVEKEVNPHAVPTTVTVTAPTTPSQAAPVNVEPAAPAPAATEPVTEPAVPQAAPVEPVKEEETAAPVVAAAPEVVAPVATEIAPVAEPVATETAPAAAATTAELPVSSADAAPAGPAIVFV